MDRRTALGGLAGSCGVARSYLPARRTLTLRGSVLRTTEVFPFPAQAVKKSHVHLNMHFAWQQPPTERKLLTLGSAGRPSAARTYAGGSVGLRAVCTSVAGVLLAAGAGSRFGRPKALVELDGQTLAERGVALLREGGADPVLVVTGAAPIQLTGTHAVYNDEWRTGMGSSLRAALRALDPSPGDESGPASGALPGDVGAVVVALADQPLVGAQAVARLMAAYRAGASVAVAAYDGKPRNPVLVARKHWPEVIASATGDTGARAFLRARPDLVTLVECGDTGSPDDIDTPADLIRVAGTLASPQRGSLPRK
jgi:CTP:molybdopterin cytidylyltransferase MocA